MTNGNETHPIDETGNTDFRDVHDGVQLNALILAERNLHERVTVDAIYVNACSIRTTRIPKRKYKYFIL